MDSRSRAGGYFCHRPGYAKSTDLKRCIRLVCRLVPCGFSDAIYALYPTLDAGRRPRQLHEFFTAHGFRGWLGGFAPDVAVGGVGFAASVCIPFANTAAIAARDNDLNNKLAGDY